MEIFAEYLSKLENEPHRARTREVLQWVTDKFPELTPKIAWNQPMFTNNGTFIIGFSVSKLHLAVAPERKGILVFSDAIQNAGYEHSKQLIRLKWELPVPYGLLKEMIRFNIADKAGYKTFWRKE